MRLDHGDDAPPKGFVTKDEPKVLWEDQHIAVIVKGSGWIVAMTREEEQTKGLVSILRRKGVTDPSHLVASGVPEHLCHFLMLKFKEQAGFMLSNRIDYQFGIAHRLDIETSGALLLGKTEVGFDHLRRAFHLHEVFKEYLCLVHGAVREDTGEINFPIQWDEARNHSYISEHGQWAKSIYTVLGRYRLKGGNKIFSLCRIVIITGRTHQIRIHMASLGHPLVSDIKYNRRNHSTDLMWCPRVFLHAWRLRFRDVDKNTQEVKVPLSKDLTKSLRTLEEIALDMQDESNPSCRPVKPGAPTEALRRIVTDRPPERVSPVKAPPPAPPTPLEPRPDPQQQPQPQRASPWQPPAPPGGVVGDGAALARARAIVALPNGKMLEEPDFDAPPPPPPPPKAAAGPAAPVASKVQRAAQEAAPLKTAPPPTKPAPATRRGWRAGPMDEQLERLVGMGFDRRASVRALADADGDFLEALEALAGSRSPSPAASSSSTAAAPAVPTPTAAAVAEVSPAQAPLARRPGAPADQRLAGEPRAAAPEAGGQGEDGMLREALEQSQREDQERRQRESAKQAEEWKALRTAIDASRREAERRTAVDGDDEAALQKALTLSQTDRGPAPGAWGHQPHDDDQDLLKALQESMRLEMQERRQRELEEVELEQALRESIREYEAFHCSGDTVDVLFAQYDARAASPSPDASSSRGVGASASSASSSSAAAAWLGGGRAVDVSEPADDDEQRGLCIQSAYNEHGEAFDDEDEVVIFGHHHQSPFEQAIAEKASQVSSASRWLSTATARLQASTPVPTVATRDIAADRDPVVAVAAASAAFGAIGHPVPAKRTGRWAK